MPHLVATLIYLSQIYSYYIKGDRSPLNETAARGDSQRNTRCLNGDSVVNTLWS